MNDAVQAALVFAVALVAGELVLDLIRTMIRTQRGRRSAQRTERAYVEQQGKQLYEVQQQQEQLTGAVAHLLSAQQLAPTLTVMRGGKGE